MTVTSGTDAVGTPEANKDLIARYFDTIWNRGEFDREPEFVALDCIVHQPPIPGLPDGIAGPLAIVGTFRGALPDLKLTNVVVIAEGDRVVQRWILKGTHTGADLFGMPAAGVALTLSGINEFRIANGVIAERWGALDVLGMLQQMGVVPDPMQSPPPDDADFAPRAVTGGPLTETEQKYGLRSHKEFMEQGLMEVCDEIYSDKATVYFRHSPPSWRVGRDGIKSYVDMLRAALPDMTITHESQVTEGEYMAIRWSFQGTHNGPMFGAQPTGNKVAIEGLDIFHVEEARITELWLEQDMIGLMAQIGLAPPPPQ
jgi:predicted ester cyclase